MSFFRKNYKTLRHDHSLNPKSTSQGCWYTFSDAKKLIKRYLRFSSDLRDNPIFCAHISKERLISEKKALRLNLSDIGFSKAYVFYLGHKKAQFFRLFFYSLIFSWPELFTFTYYFFVTALNSLFSFNSMEP